MNGIPLEKNVMKKHFRNLARDILYILLNYFVAYIPCWHIRKIVYFICGMRIGKGSRIQMRCTVMTPWRISIGQNSIINEWTLLDGRGGLTVGDSVSISSFALIYTGTHKSYSPEFEYIDKPVVIKDCCWVGARSVIMPGSILENGTIISVNGVFKGHSEKMGIYSGIPAKLERYRLLEEKYTLNNEYFFR